jgi:hypothetical protein
MTLLRAAGSGILIAMCGLVTATSLGTSVSLTACGESGSCTKLRDDTYAAKSTWEACNPDDPEPCIKVFGNTKDCTGVLSCDFAVNPHHRSEAEKSVLTIASQSQGCYLCAIPNCVSGDITLCEPVSRRCIVVTMLTDSGATATAKPTPSDSGGRDTALTQPLDEGASDALAPDL